MVHYAGLLSLLLVFTTSLAAHGDDRQRAEKQTRKIAAMATDKIGRRIVSMGLADTLKLSRPDLVEQRRKLSLDYGSFFVACELALSGTKMTDIAAALGAGKTIWQVGDGHHADWKRIATDAKKLNTRIEDYIYRHFLNKKNEMVDQQRDLAEKYDIGYDAVRTDFDVTQKEMIDAQAIYIFWRDQASASQGAGERMSPSARRAAGMDHADSRHDTNGGIAAPAAGGLPPQ